MEAYFPSASDIAEIAYPVGSIYMSVNATSPADLFHMGTWERLKDKFLLGAGDTYAAGSAGGAASISYTPAGTVGGHTLTVDEIPSHNHTFTGNAVNTGNNSVGHTHTYTDYYATTTGGTAITVAQLASHQHKGWYSWSANGWDDGRPATDGQSKEFYVDSGNITRTTGSDNSHTHSGANTSTTRTSNGVSANHTHSVTASGSIGNKGGGGAHNHGFTGTAANIATMPPYLVVYMWKRMA